MTTMDSDSESQDSDEGRRFRFEATRKDSNTGANSRKRRSSPAAAAMAGGQQKSSRRSRSRERTSRQRRENSRSRNIRRRSRETAGTRDSFRHSRDFDRITINHREARFRPDSPKFSRRDSRNHEKKRLHERDRAVSTERREKIRDRKTRHSPVEQQHARGERNLQNSRAKIVDVTRARDDTSRESTLARKTSRKNSDRATTRSPHDLVVKDCEKRDTTADKDSRNLQDCKDLNLSDFDIISDTEEHSSDNSQSRRNFRQTVVAGSNDNCQFFETNDGTRKRVSKQHYERLLKRQAVKKRRNLEEFNCPKAARSNGRDCNEETSNLSNDEKTKNSVAPSSSINIDFHEVSKLIGNSRNDILSDRTPIRDPNLAISDVKDLSLNDSSWGPILPPKSQEEKITRETGENLIIAISDEIVVEKLEKELRIVGPSLPLNFRNSRIHDDEREDSFGPALPPHLSTQSNDDDNDEEELIFYDKAAAEEKIDSLSEDEDFMGPLPLDHPALENDIVQQQLERRARRLKAELAACDNEDEKKREEWMIELPPAKTASLGLSARKFRTRPAPDMSDRSSWTDTPTDRARKRMEKLENKGLSESTTIARDTRETREMIAETEKSRKRQKSLLEIHQKKLYKKKKKEDKEAKKIGKTAERRPFDRDIDLQANRFDEARKRSMLMKSRELDDRFSRGKI